jgi:hypothetical protein
MPVEIRELVIRAVARVEARDSETEDEDFDEPPRAQEPVDDRQAIVQECVRQVLRILQQKKER